ncbi:hypothetical protein [Methylobacterium sp. Leaf456]|uniref:hypothetical protein n=1 Tax=Methylobacterium sp. Leaf456 TaxID=1736382 RepID=UPI0009E92655|nr:hypothetical protein [Methylobacterium sp. Leaf456]
MDADQPFSRVLFPRRFSLSLRIRPAYSSTCPITSRRACGFFVQQKPIKQICRELKVSRKVVRKVIRSEATAFRYTRTSQPATRACACGTAATRSAHPWRTALIPTSPHPTD